MKPQHIVATCLRILAVFWFVFALSRVNSVFTYSGNHPEVTVNSAVVWSSALLQVVFCAVLWFYPMTIAAKLIPGGGKVEEPNPPQLVEWQILGVICVGLWGLVHVIPQLAYWMGYAAFARDTYTSFDGFQVEEKARITADVVELLFSLWLVLGAKGVAALLFKIRTGGVSKT